MKTIEEQIAVMQHFANGGEVEESLKCCDEWEISKNPTWCFTHLDYRIKEKKQTVTIEKWLVKTFGNVLIVEEKEKGLFDCEDYNEVYNKIKLLDTYEVEIDD